MIRHVGSARPRPARFGDDPPGRRLASPAPPRGPPGRGARAGGHARKRAVAPAGGEAASGQGHRRGPQAGARLRGAHCLRGGRGLPRGRAADDRRHHQPAGRRVHDRPEAPRHAHRPGAAARHTSGVRLAGRADRAGARGGGAAAGSRAVRRLAARGGARRGRRAALRGREAVRHPAAGAAAGGTHARATRGPREGQGARDQHVRGGALRQDYRRPHRARRRAGRRAARGRGAVRPRGNRPSQARVGSPRGDRNARRGGGERGDRLCLPRQGLFDRLVPERPRRIEPAAAQRRCSRPPAGACSGGT